MDKNLLHDLVNESLRIDGIVQIVKEEKAISEELSKDFKNSLDHISKIWSELIRKGNV